MRPTEYIGIIGQLIGKADIDEQRIAELEAALVNILGWRERDYTNMADTLHYIEEIATKALEKKAGEP